MVAIRGHARSWSAHAALGVAITFAGSGGALSDPEANDNRNQPTATQASYEPSHKANPTLSAVIHGDAQRIASALEANNRRTEAAYAKADADKSAIAAQDAAYWAKWLFIAGIAETLVTAIGVVLVVLTLSETRKSAKEMKRSADAATLQTKAAIRLQLPILRVNRPELIWVTEFPAEGVTYSSQVLERAPGSKSMIRQIRINNEGNSPAFITSLDMGHAIANELSGEPIYKESYKFGHNTLVEEEGSLFDVRIRIELNETQVANCAAQTEYIWFYARAIYDDFMDDEREDRFCWRFTPQGRRWLFIRAYKGDVPRAYILKRQSTNEG